MRVLVIDDDVMITGFLQDHLTDAGFAIDIAHDGATGIHCARINEYDLVLLDLNLPDMLGGEVIKMISTFEKRPPVLLLTVVADPWSKVELINAGADDYLVKPFLLDELIARMRALLRRGTNMASDVLTAGDVTLDVRAQMAWRAGTILPLTRKEICLLEYLLRNPGRVVSKTELVEHVWDGSVNPFSAAIDTHLTNLRKKLREPCPIQTVHGRGYLISA